MTNNAKLATAYHEALHAVICWRFGVRVPKPTIVPTANSTGFCHHEKIIRGRYPEADTSNRTRLRMEKCAAIALAGAIAQQLYKPRSFRNYHGSADYGVAAEMALRTNETERAAKAWLRWLEVTTQDQLREFWAIVDQVAQKLIEVKTLDAEQIRCIIFNVREPV